MDRKLRDKARTDLGLSPRPDRKQLDLAEHARVNGINPVVDLGKEGSKTGARRRRLQTLLLAESLDPRMEAIRNLARLSEQEMGFSTLFLAFGFLEWRQSESSSKSLFAPLLLLPAVVETRIENGRKIYGVRATAETPETNVTLKKNVEDDFGRMLPEVDADDETDFSVEAYLSQVEKAIEGLSGWRVHRFLTLGHFAFGRLAMYQDLESAEWESLCDHPLVGAILSGVERDGEQRDENEVGGLPEVPEDYKIDTPEIEAVAPVLIHDADASQHSAIVDVMKGFNLVIEGPPGTGKSQTITNIIANALVGEGARTVLFLSGKTLRAEGGEASPGHRRPRSLLPRTPLREKFPREVVQSLRERVAVNGADGNATGEQLSRNFWETSRRDISSYLDALHAREHAGESAFTLFSRAISRAGDYAALPDAVRRVDFPDALLEDEEKLRDTLAAIERHQRWQATSSATSAVLRPGPHGRLWV